MTTRLDGALRREIEVDGRPYTVLLTPEYLRLTPKGKRKGMELAWKELLNGDKALAVALNASLANLPGDARRGRQRPAGASRRKEDKRGATR